MYPLGVMFGLGFDTSSEVALLGIASVQGATGTSIWLILMFPLLFTGEFETYLTFEGRTQPEESVHSRDVSY